MQPTEIPLLSYLIAGVIVILLLSLRMRRMTRSVPLRLKRLWIAPTILLIMAAVTLMQSPLSWPDGILLGLAFLIGAALGWQRGKLMSIALDPANRTLTTKATPMAMYFLLGIILVRFSLRAGLGLQTHGWGIAPAVVNDIFVIFAAGLFLAQGLEMAVRARRLLGAAAVQVDNLSA